ncbi:MAG: Gfo/Idh/MocA family oxidoreductase [Clostridia bacterium]|nr:Gfo/Idh/MocA family oxidoreductase [Clostridia bacterium]
MKKIALLGLWHVHSEWYYNCVKDISEVVGVYDDDPQRLEKFCNEYGLHAFNSEEELLASDADGVIVCNATCDHTESMIKIAEAGKDIFTEKVLAITNEECERIAEAVRRNDVKFVISLVFKAFAPQLTVKKVADSGELGKITSVRYRNCHSGSSDGWLPPHFYDKKQCGGGAMMDLGAHGMYLIDWILGEPDTYSSTFSYIYGHEVEDNAVTVMGYKNGAIAINETSFVNSCCPETYEVCGEKGKVYYRKGPDIQPTVYKATEATDKKWVEVPPVTSPDWPVVQFATDNVLEGFGLEDALRLTRMMEGAYNNAK